MRSKIYQILVLVFCAIVLGLSLRGLPGNPSSEEINQSVWKEEGPLELSPERGRYALTVSLVENQSFHFDLPLARFVTPDLGYIDGKYVSLFAPAVSFIAIPGYIVGSALGVSQLGAFSVILLFAITNVILIRAISKLLGANSTASTIVSLIFLLATPAFPYGVTLYQHHITTFLILSGLWLLLKYKSKFSLAIIWFLCAISIPVDYPNLFFMFPIGVYTLARTVNLKEYKSRIQVKLNPLTYLTLISVLLPLGFFLWFNNMSYGDPLQFSGTVASVEEFDTSGNPVVPTSENHTQAFEKSSIGFFNTREMLYLGYIHLFSPDRGLLFYAPIILLGVLGMRILYKKKSGFTALMLAIIGFNIVLYSMFGQGGWAFGSRYLIPTYAIMSVFLAVALSKYRKKSLFLLVFLLLAIYSISVNTLGALTTNAVPPKVEAVALEPITGRKEHYTYLRNWEFLSAGKSKSFVFQTFAKNYISARQFYFIVAGSIVLVMGSQLAYLYLEGRRKNR